MSTAMVSPTSWWGRRFTTARLDLDSDSGSAYLYLGSSTGLSVAAAWSAEGRRAGAHFGQSVSPAGDVNADGYSEVLVGADTGRAYLHFGGIGGLATFAGWSAGGGPPGGGLDVSVRGAGDVNGDGLADVLVGWRGHDGVAGMDSGAVFLYSASHPTRAGAQAASQQRNASDTRALSQLERVGDSVLLHLHGAPTIGRNRAKLQWEIKPLGTPFDGSGLGSAGSFVDTTTSTQSYSALADPPGSGVYRWRVRLLLDPTASYDGEVAGRWYYPMWPQPLLGDFGGPQTCSVDTDCDDGL